VLNHKLFVNDSNKRNSDVFIQKTEPLSFFKRSQRHKNSERRTLELKYVYFDSERPLWTQQFFHAYLKVTVSTIQ